MTPATNIAGELRETAWVAARMGVSERTVRRYIEDDHLPFTVTPGGHYRVPEDAVHELMTRLARERAEKHAARRRRRARPGSAPAAPEQEQPQPRAQRKRRPKLGQPEPAAFSFDLSADTLRGLRAQTA